MIMIAVAGSASLPAAAAYARDARAFGCLETGGGWWGNWAALVGGACVTVGGILVRFTRRGAGS